MSQIKSLNDVKANRDNPRTISPQRMLALTNSIIKFGDLSGIVVNVHKGKNILISGHQRTKSLGKKTKVVKNKHKDSHGTVAVGYVETPDGVRVPYREVDWKSKDAELAALIAANAHGGQFDQAKLGSLVAALDKRKFDIELTGLDTVEAKRSILEFKKNSEGRKNSEVAASSGKAFQEYGTSDIEGTEITCPHCGKHFVNMDGGVGDNADKKKKKDKAKDKKSKSKDKPKKSEKKSDKKKAKQAPVPKKKKLKIVR